MFKFFLKFIVNKFFKNLLNFFLKRNNIVILFRSGSAIGDHVYMSSIVREISTKLKKKIILFTNYYEFFINNPRIYKLFKIKKKNILWFFLNNMRCETILEFRSIHKDINNKHFLYYHKKKKIHLAQAMSEHFNLNIDYKDLRNEIFFSKNKLVTKDPSKTPKLQKAWKPDIIVLFSRFSKLEAYKLTAISNAP